MVKEGTIGSIVTRELVGSPITHFLKDEKKVQLS